jgi:hypothetical protein
MTDSLSGVDPSSVNFAVLDSDDTVQPTGPVTLGPGGTYSFTVLLEASRQGTDLNGRSHTHYCRLNLGWQLLSSQTANCSSALAASDFPGARIRI